MMKTLSGLSELNRKYHRTISTVQFVHSDWSLVCEWYAVKVSSLVFKCSKIVHQNDDRNFWSQSLIIWWKIFQSCFIKSDRSVFAQFSAE